MAEDTIRARPASPTEQLRDIYDYIRGFVFRDTASPAYGPPGALEAGQQHGSYADQAAQLAMIGGAAKGGFKSISDVATRLNVLRAKGANPAELGPAGPTAITARNQIAENLLPTVENAMRRVRPMERSTQGGTAPRVSAQDLAQDFISKDLQGVIDRYDPTSPQGIEASVRSRAVAGSRAAREMEAAVPKPGEGDIHRMSAKIARVEQDFQQARASDPNYHGEKPSYMWVARKLGITPQAAQDAMAAKEKNQLHGSVRFDEMAPGTKRPYSELIGSEGETGGASNPNRTPSSMQAIEGSASQNPNLAAATKFMDQLDPQRKAILTKMMESKPTRQIAEEMKAEGHDISQPTVSRRQTELMGQLKQLREGSGFLGGLGGLGGKLDVPRLIKAQEKPTSATELGKSGGFESINPGQGEPSVPPTTYAGYQQGFGTVPGFHMYHLNVDIKDPKTGAVLHPRGSTLSPDTLDKYQIPYDKMQER